MAGLKTYHAKRHFGVTAEPKGKVNRRGFLERVAVRTSFPKPLQLGGEKKWKREEVAMWAEAERRVANR